MIIEGCILICLAIVFLILAKTVNQLKSSDSYETVDGMIAKSDRLKKEVIVNYTINGISYSAPYLCEQYADVGEMPPVGLKVQIMVDSDSPDKIMFMHMMREMGQGLSRKRKYTDNTSKKNGNSIIFIIVALFVSGIYLILHGLSVI
ncbi:MAG: hypothetical protein K2H82_00735 [Oscillospiraceae bacterium]|nr:hypothetical protein [Oscillospiraceae bacterium]